MPRIETLHSLALQSGHADLPVLAPITTRKSAMAPYDAGAGGRRNYGWQPPRLGQNTLLITNMLQMVARSRQSVRNDAWANAAINRFESNVVGTGIQPHWGGISPDIRTKIHASWERWQKRADYLGQSDFYTLQAIAAREIFEAGEVFGRMRLRPKKDKLNVPFQIQLIESEQLPVFYNSIAGSPTKNSIRAGIEIDPDQRRVSYHFYAEHPGESMLYPAAAMTYIEVDAKQVIHVYKPTRAGQLRGEPRMTAVMALMYELEQYEDAALVKKKIQEMFAAFIQKPAPDVDVVPLDTTHTPPTDMGVGLSKIEAGTINELLPGEEIVFPSLPRESDFNVFMSWALHKFAAGVGLTFEQVTGNLEGVNYSSIRAGMLEFRRSCEQFQFNVMVHQFCDPIACRWLDEAVLCGELDLPNYFTDPYQYQNITWVPPGWDWVDPQKESEAAKNDVRSGFSSRTLVVRKKGYDPEMVDAQSVEERSRAAKLGLVYISDPGQILEGRETQPTVEVQTDPDQEAAEFADNGDGTVGPTKSAPQKAAPSPAGGNSGVTPTSVPRRAVPIKVPMKPPPAEKPKTNGHA